MNKKEVLKGTDCPRYLLGDVLEECSNMYGNKFEELWNSLTPEMKDVKFGKIIFFGTADYLNQQEDEL